MGCYAYIALFLVLIFMGPAAFLMLLGIFLLIVLFRDADRRQ